MTGTLVPGTRLPTERSLAEEFKVSRTSVREALSELESKHLIERVQGRGSTILDPMSNTRKLATMLEASDMELQNATELRGQPNEPYQLMLRPWKVFSKKRPTNLSVKKNR